MSVDIPQSETATVQPSPAIDSDADVPKPLPTPLTPEQGEQLLTYINDLFGPDGKLVKSGRSYRKQQHTLALAIAQSFIQGKHGMYEGAVGVGKTFAYLASVLWISSVTGRRAVIAVSTNSLLDQIYADIPLLSAITGLRVQFGQLKGRANYVCQDMRDESIYKANGGRLRLDSEQDYERAERFLTWAQEGTDLTHYDDAPPPRVVRLATITGKECKARRGECQYALPYLCETCQKPIDSPDCPDDGKHIKNEDVWGGDEDAWASGYSPRHVVRQVGTRCYFTLARRRSLESAIVVTNLNLLLLNHDMKQILLGKFDYIVLDEAHEVNSKVRDEYSQDTAFNVFDKAAEKLAALANNARNNKLRQLGLDAANALDGSTSMLRAACVQYALRHDSPGNRGREIEALVVGGKNGNPHSFDSQKLFSAAVDLKRCAEQARDAGMAIGDKATGDDPADSDITEQAYSVHDALTLLNPNEAVGIILPDKTDPQVRPKLRTIPVDVGGFVRSSILTEGITLAVSATLTVDGKSWDLPRKQLGMPEDALVCAVDSPFDYAQNAVVYVPGSMPASHKRDDYNAAASAEAAAIVQAMGGRTLVLCSARDDMEVARRAIADSGFNVMVQGSAPPRELARRFKTDTSSCLVGSKTFGTGFDVQGDALQCVILWKLPFAKQTLVDEFIKRRDGEGSWRGGHYTPAMLLDLRQWAGRLIRHHKDIGVIVLMDTMKVAQLKRAVLPALPKGAPLLREVDEIEAFMFGKRMGGGVTPMKCQWCEQQHDGGPENCKG